MSGPCGRAEADRALEKSLVEATSRAGVERGVPMSRHTSFKIGGPADFLVTVESVGELLRVLGECRRRGAPFLVLGRGTNLLVRDGGIRGVVVRPAGDLAATTFDGERVRAGAAAGLADLARECGRRGLSGMEFAVGIPGSVGGAVIMNAGAYDSEMAKVVESADFITTRDLIESVPAGLLEFGYRTSRPQREGWVVVSATLRLACGDLAAIRRREEENTAKRETRQPTDFPSAGSVFKRPPGRYTGTLIQEAGCRGLRVGDAQVSERHAGFIVNLGSATARDVLELIERVRQTVQAHAGVWLEPELRVVGED